MTGERAILDGEVDFTMMNVAHDAFTRDLRLEPVAAKTVSPPGRPGTDAGKSRLLRWWRELLLVAAWYVGYEAVRAASPAQAGAARTHAHQLIGIERWAHLDPERLLNHAASGSSWLGVLSGYYYASLHFAVTLIVLIWLYWRHRPLYRRARSVLIGASAASLLVFWFYPVAPPRFAMYGLHDIVATHNVFGARHAATSGTFVDLYAALPSLHVGWAFWVAAVIVRACAQGGVRHLAWLYPVATTLIVLATGNHYFVDAVAGVSVVALSGLAQRLLSSHRRRSRTRADCSTSFSVPAAQVAAQQAGLVPCRAGRP